MSSSSNGGSPSSDSSSSSSSSPSNNSKSQSPSFETEDSSSSDNNNNNNNNNNNSSSQSPPPNNDSSSGKDDNSSSSNNNNGNNNNNNNSNNNNSNSQSPPPSNNDGKNNSSPPNDNNNNNNNNNNNSNNNNGNNNNGNNNNNNNSGNKSPPPSSPPPKSSNSSKSPLSPPPPPSLSSLNYSPNSRPLSPPKTESTDSVSKDTTAAIKIGVAAGAGVLFIVMIIFLISCCKRKKKRKQNQMKHNQMGYYQDNSRGAMNNHYYNNNNNGMHGNNWQNSNKFQPADQFHKIPPPPGSAQVSSEHSWPIAPPPPPPMMSSSELSSAAFSGPHQPPMPPPHPAMALGYNQSSFTYDDLAVATGGFAKDKLLGQGGFGYVHKGVLPNGKEVAVKSLKSNSGQGEREFQAEVDIISRVHHRHLVSLVGYCIAGSQRMLVYEFVVNNTLEYHLHGPGRPPMDFNTRHKIALGAAKGFAYLHEDCHPKIIHRDIKAANILLDENFEAKVADFGLAKLSTDNHTHVSTRIMGTFGYLAPEYASSGKLTEKSDVYSYGVMLLELITGRRPVDMEGDDDTLVEWARPILLRATEGGDYDELIDPSLEGKFDAQQMLCMVACAAATIRHSAKKRPKMSQIVRALEDEVTLDDLDEGGKLGHNATSSYSGSSEHDGGSYDLKKFRKSSMSSQEYSSSENGESREYRQNKK